jgi:hypothetical protein
MSIAPSAACRLRLSLVVSAAMALPLGCGSQSNAPGDPPNLAAGGGSSAGAAGSAGSGPVAGAAGVSGAGVSGAGVSGTSGAAGSGVVSWCQAYKLINCVCQQCHQKPTLHGAAMPLMTFEDTQAPFPYPTSTATVWQTMQGVIANRVMPYTGDSTLVPPVKPLTDVQRDTLLAWLAQGATAAGGTVCPMTCDWSKGPPTGPF